MQDADNPNVVSVEAPARLHLGFLDLNGSLGRRYGSLGLTLDGMGLRLRARLAHRLSAEGPQAERALAHARTLQRSGGLRSGCALTLERAITPHAGLGSGTQLGLAVGAALSALHGLRWDARRIAGLLGRGARSGIGVGAFEQGGFLLDAGRGPGEATPPLVSRLPFPAAWRVILVFDPAACGLHGAQEQQAFGALPPFPEATAARLCRLALMQILPGLAEEDIDTFGAAITEVQRVIGDHFAAAQGGRYTSARVARALAHFEARRVAGFGQSSWGPTGFAFAPSQEQALALVDSARRALADPQLELRIVAARNRGAQLNVLHETAGRDRAPARDERRTILSG